MAALVIPEPIAEAIEAAYSAAQSPADYLTLRSSEIGEDCERKLWYRLHWTIEPKRWTGRMLRLFETGHREELRVIDNLGRIGVQVFDEQKRINPMADGLLTGSIDGIALNVPSANKTDHLLEIKTHNDAQWTAWRRGGVRKSHPKHFAQMQAYMSALGLKRALYCAHNKNTDELQFERIEADNLFAIQLESKAKRIAFNKTIPAKCSESPDFWTCKLCEFHEVCHGEGTVRKHCRTCIFSSFVRHDGGKILCEKHNQQLGFEDQQSGCISHLFIPALVHGQQIDADEIKNTITYRMKDGSTFVDGPHP